MIRLLRAALAAGALVACALAACAAPGPGPGPESLIGLWAAHTSSLPGLHGPLTVTREGQAWRASLGGRQVSVRGDGTDLRFVFPAGDGQFRGRLSKDGQRIEGFWVQPAKGFGELRQPYATPLALTAAPAGGWRGEVQPLANGCTFYLKVSRDADGAVTAALRNPEANLNGGRTQFLVTVEGARLRLTTRPAEGQRTIALNATVAGDHLRLTLPGLGFGHDIDLMRGAPQDAAAFFPRPPGAPAYAYSPPPDLNDGWTTARAEQAGLDEAALARIVQAQIDSDPAGKRPPLIHSILVAHHGKLVLEEYFSGHGRDEPHDTRSAAKTFNSVMLGAVMLHDPALRPDSRIYDLMAARGPFAKPDPRKAEITLAHLMTHTSGLACDDNDDNSPGNEETLQSQTTQPDWSKYTLDLPMAHDPGSRYAYCSANANLVAAGLAARTGEWIPELFDRTIARPLQFGPWYWDLTPTGEGYGGGGVRVRPRDLLKIGQTFLDGGVWHGRRIVSADWVKASTAPHIDVSPATTGLSKDDFGNFYGVAKDGYAWHLNDLKVGDRVYRDYEATGNGGQLLIVVPDADLAVVITAGNYGQGGIWTRWRDSIVAQQIIPAIR
jgi:CubicO group peptidase (beta-lactamase class C family)